MLSGSRVRADRRRGAHGDRARLHPRRRAAGGVRAFAYLPGNKSLTSPCIFSAVGPNLSSQTAGACVVDRVSNQQVPSYTFSSAKVRVMAKSTAVGRVLQAVRQAPGIAPRRPASSGLAADLGFERRHEFVHEDVRVLPDAEQLDSGSLDRRRVPGDSQPVSSNPQERGRQRTPTGLHFLSLVVPMAVPPSGPGGVTGKRPECGVGDGLADQQARGLGQYRPVWLQAVNPSNPA